MEEKAGIIDVVPVRSASERRAWLDLAETLHRGDPAWVAPLTHMMKERIDPKHNPFFKHGEAELWLAKRDGAPVARVSSQINRLHLQRYDDATGHFGFFECVDDEEVAAAVLRTAEAWLRARGMRHVTGPFEFSINEECGLLVEGFGSAPAILMTHAKRSYAPLLERAGYRKAKDLLAYRIDMRAALSPAATRFLALGKNHRKLSLRYLDKHDYDAEVRRMIDVFNDAWSDNWGFIPITKEQTSLMAKSMKPLFVPDLGVFAEVNGETAGTIAALPNLNEAISDFGGRLLPFNWLRLLWRLKGRGLRSARVILLGIKKSYRRTPLAPAIASGLIGRLIESGRRLNMEWGELSWVLEDNEAMTSLGTALAGPPVKTYRIYAKDL